MEEIKQELEVQQQEPALPAEEEAQPPQRDYAGEVAALYEARPELRGTELPSSVVAACVAGKPLREAYNDYARQQRMARSPRRPAVKGVSGGAPESRAEDPFLRGCNAAW